MESQLLRKIRSLEDPRPHINEAKDAFSRMVTLQKDLLFLEAETRSWYQLQRLIFAIGAILALEATVTLSLFWICWGLHANGWSPWVLSLVSFLVMGTLSLALARVAAHYGSKALTEGNTHEPA